VSWGFVLRERSAAAAWKSTISVGGHAGASGGVTRGGRVSRCLTCNKHPGSLRVPTSGLSGLFPRPAGVRPVWDCGPRGSDRSVDPDLPRSVRPCDRHGARAPTVGPAKASRDHVSRYVRSYWSNREAIHGGKPRHWTPDAMRIQPAPKASASAADRGLWAEKRRGWRRAPERANTGSSGRWMTLPRRAVSVVAPVSAQGAWTCAPHQEVVRVAVKR
jgi:hypothetical protein